MAAVVTLVALLAVAAVVVGYPSLASSSATPPGAARPSGHRLADDPRGRLPQAAGVADGVLPSGVTVFDDRYPGVADLDPALLDALRRAATDAAQDGVELVVNSGWRSRAYQEQLFRQALARYGSTEQAARWVAPPGTSVHEAGKAVDLGPADATAWLSEHGAAYGLCQIYTNEPWHYELRPDAVDHGCPTMYADPTDDPRLSRQQVSGMAGAW